MAYNNGLLNFGDSYVEVGYDNEDYSVDKAQIVEKDGTVHELGGGGGDNLFSIKTVVIDYTTQEPITDPDLYVSAEPVLLVPLIAEDPEPYLFKMLDNGTIDMYYQNYDEPGTVIDTINVKTKYPLYLGAFEVLIGDTVKTIDDGTYNNTPVDPTNGFPVEESGTLKLFVL